MTKVQIFKDLNIDLATIYRRLRKMVLDDGFKLTRDETTENVHHLKGEKTGVTQIVVGAVRDIELVIAGDQSAFAIILSVGAWGKNLAFSSSLGYVVAAVAEGPAIAFGSIAATGSYVRAYSYEKDLWSKILALIDKESKKVSKKKEN